MLAKMIIAEIEETQNRLEYLFKKLMKKTPVLASRGREAAYDFADSASMPSCLTILSWEEAARNISLNKGSLKQLMPVSSN